MKSRLIRIIVLATVFLVSVYFGVSAPHTYATEGASSSPLSSSVMETEGMEQNMRGEWELTARQGSFTVNGSEEEAVYITLPVDGPVLIPQDGTRSTIVHISDESIVRMIQWEDGVADEAMEFHVESVMEETKNPYILSVDVGAVQGTTSHTDNEVQLMDVGRSNAATIEIKGRGWGHRVGMSQHGMAGLANLGVSYTDILDHYYPGTRTEKRYSDSSQRVTVRIDNGTARDSWEFTPSVDSELFDRRSNETIGVLEAEETYTVEMDEAEQYFTISPTPVDGEEELELTDVVVRTNNDVTFLQFFTTSGRYYHGNLRFFVQKDGDDVNGIELRNDVRLDHYVNGVVPYEAYASWPSDALKAQSVAARTFVAGRNFSVRDTTLDQVYRGVYQDQRYVDGVKNAVAGTDGEVVTFHGSLATTSYSSSNGGWRENNTDAFGSSTLIDYLRASKDEFVRGGNTIIPEEYASRSGDQLVPHGLYRWSEDVSVSAIESRYSEIGQLTGIYVLGRTDGQGADRVEIRGTDGSVERNGRQLRSELGLRSTYIFPQPLYPVTTSRVYGGSRYDTAVEVSQQGWDEAETVVLATGENYADALAGVPLAYELDAPILLTETDALHAAAKAELGRLQASEVIILGGSLAISDSVENELEQMGLDVTRVSGANRYETAGNISRMAYPQGNRRIVLVNGENFPDAISAAAYAAQAGYPILLTEATELPDATLEAAQDLGHTGTYVIGGSGAIDNSVFAPLPGGARLGGANRYETNIRVAEYFEPESEHIYVATGRSYADALTGAVLAAKENRGIFLVDRYVPQAFEGYARANGVERATILGGDIAVSSSVESDIRSIHAD